MWGPPDVHVGVDLDNTIISYDRVIHSEASKRGLLPGDVPAVKRAVRDHLRSIPGGEAEWQRIQAAIYGPMIAEAELIPGVEEFFSLCDWLGVETSIISHKTEYANYDETRTSLREAALEWLEERLFPQIRGMDRGRVLFGATRDEKISHIRVSRCTHFIDDLEEVFDHPSFPDGVAGFLYAPHGQVATRPGVTIVKTWQEITDVLGRLG